MARKATNNLLRLAKSSKRDEFYTRYEDIERELSFYSEVFRGKVVYCNADDPERSAFVRYFRERFRELGLRVFIASCIGDPHGKILRYDGEDYRSAELDGTGDFRSEECLSLLAEADVVVTNPPFSLFRELIALLDQYGKGFLLIANINAITYKEVFGLIQRDKAWLGCHLGRGISGFIVPPHYPLSGTEARIDERGNRVVSTNNCLWLTNLLVSRRKVELPLSCRYLGNESDYPRYDNYDAIDVGRTKDIPMDYPGVMGVPITFLHKHSPNQFEIVGFRKGTDGKDFRIQGKCPYFRILIRNRKVVPSF